MNLKNTVDLSTPELMDEALKVTDKICDQMPGHTRLGWCLAFATLAIQLKKQFPADWERALEILTLKGTL